ncbi:hypothetical protein BDV59DRAFT_209444 [Aspergillus ambiguus]|uniref:DUF3176 domain-containing protein n=1 Tax=Aspergillus ambiguus TaxID=176160 RepID=UPI003CCDC045
MRIQASPSCSEPSLSGDDRPAIRWKTASKWSNLSLDTWFWESLSMGFSIACFISIISILFAYDEKPLPNFPHGLTLNAIVASIGQLKWIWFRRRNKLYDIQYFDDATRGPLGSIIILFKHRALSLVSLGALVTILALIFDPFVQQAVTYPVRQVTSASHLAKVKQGNPSSIPLLWTDYDATWAVNAPIWADNFDISPSCPWGNCTWPPFRSMGYCSKCEDITSTVTLSGCQDIFSNISSAAESKRAPCNISVPPTDTFEIPIRFGTDSDGDWLDISKDFAWYAKSNGSVPFEQMNYAGVRFPVIVINYAQLDVPDLSIKSHAETGLKINKVTQCPLTYCARTYDISVTNGIPLIKDLSEDWGEMTLQPDMSHMCWKPKVDPSDFVFCRVMDVGLNISPFQGINSSTWRHYPNQEQADISGWRHVGTGTEQTSFEHIVGTGLEAVMHRLADSLSKVVRDRSNSTIDGVMYASETHISVDWKWLALPVTVMLLSIIFWACTVHVNRNYGSALWKTSSLPLLYHGLDDFLDSDVEGEKATISRMEEAARSVNVQFQFSNVRRRLMLQR